jgi:putative colanic acid biosynthesis UDP-glucose lipid carrier transferase
MKHHGMIKKHSQTLGLIQRFLDISLIASLLILSKTFYGQIWNEPRTLTAMFLTVAFYLFLSELSGLYRSWQAQSIWREFSSLLFTLSGTFLGLLFVATATKTSTDFSRLAIGTWMLSLPFGLLLLRVALRNSLRYMRRQGFKIRKVAVLGTGQSAQQLVEEISSNDWMGMMVVGFYDNRRKLREVFGETPSASIVGDIDDLIKAAKNNELDDIYIALPTQAAELVNRTSQELRDSSTNVHIAPDLFTFKLLNARTSHIGQIPIFSIHEAPMDDLELILKRFLDLALGLIILFIIALPMLLIAIAIKLDSKGPVIFKQRRYGLRGEEIWVWKFRSMTVTEDDKNITQVTRSDKRIRPLGKFLRRSSLDELPQFINVLQGTMSIVGPRPHAVVHNELYRKTIDGYMLRHLVKPGITGWAQVNGWRGETDTDEKMEKRIEFDMEYLRKWSILLDLKIIALTVVKGFFNKNAF